MRVVYAIYFGTSETLQAVRETRQAAARTVSNLIIETGMVVRCEPVELDFVDAKKADEIRLFRSTAKKYGLAD